MSEPKQNVSPPKGRPKHRLSLGCALFALLFQALACGPLETGDTELITIPRIPDPVEFGSQVHPVLVASCAAAACHGRTGTFRLHPTEPLTPDAEFSHPLDLPEPFLSDYYQVLSLCDMELPESSPIINWGKGLVLSHPGGSALSPDDEATLVDWLRLGGGP